MTASFLLASDIDEIVANLPIGMLRQLAGKHIVITGARGFLGRYLTAVIAYLNEHHLLEKPLRVTGIDNFISSGEEGIKVPKIPHIEFIAADVIQPLVADLGRIDYIFHAAGIASPAHYRKYPLETLEVATTGLKNMLELARANEGCRFSFFSSSEIYGDPDPSNVPTKETYRGNVACLGPRACYDMSKRLGETMVQIYAQQYGVHATIIRPFNVYGPGMQEHDYRVLPNFAARIAQRKDLEVYGDGKQTRTYCYVTDAIGGFLRVLVNGEAGEPYNIGNPSPEISVNDLATTIAKALPSESIHVHRMPHPASYPADEPNRRCPDITKARTLGYSPRITLDDGLKRFFGWALSTYARAEKPPLFLDPPPMFGVPEIGDRRL